MNDPTSPLDTSYVSDYLSLITLELTAAHLARPLPAYPAWDSTDHSDGVTESGVNQMAWVAPCQWLG